MKKTIGDEAAEIPAELVSLIKSGVIVSPDDGTPLSIEGESLVSESGYHYPVVAGVPILISEKLKPNFDGQFEETKRLVGAYKKYGLEALPAHYRSAQEALTLYQRIAGAFAGRMYEGVTFKRFSLPFPPHVDWGDGQLFLDIGSGWGRWCHGARVCGFLPIGVDPSLSNILLGKRIAAMLHLNYNGIVADGRNIPVRDGSVSAINCYSVLHHMNQEDFELTIGEVGRSLRHGGRSVLQISNLWSPRHMIRSRARNYGKAQFSVRYRSPSQTLSLLEDLIGTTEMFAHGAVTTSTTLGDSDIIRPVFSLVNIASHLAGEFANKTRLLRYFVDSIYYRSTANA